MRIDCSQQSRKSNENSDAEKVDDDDDDKNRNMKQAALDALDVSQLPSRIMRFSDRIAANCCLSQGAAPNSRIVFLNVNLLRQEIESNLPSMPKEVFLFQKFNSFLLLVCELLAAFFSQIIRLNIIKLSLRFIVKDYEKSNNLLESNCEMFKDWEKLNLMTKYEG
ncbi:MAG: hypothetical protein MHMPM18_003067 [Marteilia pararefringens]